MKHAFTLILAALLLTSCSGEPVVQKGNYDASLEAVRESVTGEARDDFDAALVSIALDVIEPDAPESKNAEAMAQRLDGMSAAEIIAASE